MHADTTTVARGLRTALLAAVALPAAAAAQDSVALLPGQGGDALPPYETHLLRYVVDLAPITSSWGAAYAVGPVLKASADPEADGQTLLAAAAALSPDRIDDVTMQLVEYSLWFDPGSGVNPSKNSGPGSILIDGFDRQLGVGLTSTSGGPSDAVGALVGQNNGELSRLFVTRITAAASRASAGAADTATLALSAIDASGAAYLRTDGFGVSGPGAARGDSVARVDLTQRDDAVVNTVRGAAGGAVAGDPGAAAFSLDQSATATAVPGALPASLGAGPRAILLDFAGRFSLDAASPTTDHLAPGVEAHRGGPSVAPIADGAQDVLVGALARSADAGRTESILLFGLDADGPSITQTTSASLPSPITAPGFTTNETGAAAFNQYQSQVCFRGPAGLVGVGRLGADGAFVAAATATDPEDGDFIAVADFAPGGPAWTVAAHAGKPVLDGPGGAPIGELAAGDGPASLSAPAVDLLGNVYFVGGYAPQQGEPRAGFFKAVRDGAEYELELILAVGDQTLGQNSGTTYTIDRLTLSDADSLASGAFHAGQLHQLQIAGLDTSDPASPFAMGGAVVNARITYDNAGTPESYDALLYVGPRQGVVLPDCPGDLNGDLVIDSGDLNALLLAFGQSAAGDIDGDADTDSGDLNLLLAAFGGSCE